MVTQSHDVHRQRWYFRLRNHDSKPFDVGIKTEPRQRRVHRPRVQRLREFLLAGPCVAAKSSTQFVVKARALVPTDRVAHPEDHRLRIPRDGGHDSMLMMAGSSTCTDWILSRTFWEFGGHHGGKALACECHDFVNWIFEVVRFRGRQGTLEIKLQRGCFRWRGNDGGAAGFASVSGSGYVD